MLHVDVACCKHFQTEYIHVDRVLKVAMRSSVIRRRKKCKDPLRGQTFLLARISLVDGEETCSKEVGEGGDLVGGEGRLAILSICSRWSNDIK